MKKIVILLLSFLLLANCRSRKKSVQNSEYHLEQVEKTDTLTEISTEKKVQDIDLASIKKDHQIKENEGDIIIKGKTDSLKDFRFHNVVDGDTLSDIYIYGNADFIIKNRWKKIEVKETIESKTEKLNIVAQVARKSVAQSTMKEVAEKIKKVETKVSSKGFTFPIYIIVGFSLLLLIILFFLWRKFGGGIVDRFRNGKVK